jgi:hypothetical protein
MPKGEHGGEIFSHVHRAIDILTPTEKTIAKGLSTIEWYTVPPRIIETTKIALDGTKTVTKITENPGTKIQINLPALFANCNVSKNDMKVIFRLMTRYIIKGNKVGILALSLYMMGSLGVEGRQRKDILEAIGGSTKKIMETIQTQRTRKITAGKEANVDTDDDKDGE